MLRDSIVMLIICMLGGFLICFLGPSAVPLSPLRSPTGLFIPTSSPTHAWTVVQMDFIVWCYCCQRAFHIPGWNLGRTFQCSLGSQSRQPSTPSHRLRQSRSPWLHWYGSPWCITKCWRSLHLVYLPLLQWTLLFRPLMSPTS